MTLRRKKLKYGKIFGSSKLTKRFFIIFVGSSLLAIISIILITSVIIFFNAPDFKDHPLPPPHEMTNEEEVTHFEGNRPPEKMHRFRHRPPKKPGPPPGLIRDIAVSLSIFGVLAVIFSFIVAHYLSKYFLLPISQIADATKKFSKHDFSLRIHVDRKDEIGLLAKDFNDMADKLQKYEEMRKQWIADVAHELRTPVSILQAEVEAVQDQVRSLDMKTMDRLHGEIRYLAKTINDLYKISIAESGRLTLNLENVSVSDILIDASLRFKERLGKLGIQLEMNLLNNHSSIITADSYLLQTVFNNIFENSLRYTDSPGEMKVFCCKEENFFIISIEDSPPNVPDEYINKIFDRLFRVDSSRSRKHGGSGLGLSICKTLIESSGGTISASNSSLGGLKIVIKLPIISGDNR